MYKVIYKFADLQDSKFVYNVGDAYPREGSNPSEERIAELAGDSNRIGRPLIEAVEPIQEEKPKPKRNRKKKADAE